MNLENLLNEIRELPSEAQVKKIKDLLVLQTQNLNSLTNVGDIIYMGNIDESKEGNNK